MEIDVVKVVEQEDVVYIFSRPEGETIIICSIIPKMAFATYVNYYGFGHFEQPVIERDDGITIDDGDLELVYTTPVTSEDIMWLLVAEDHASLALNPNWRREPWAQPDDIEGPPILKWKKKKRVTHIPPKKKELEIRRVRKEKHRVDSGR